jgi:DNA-3-methyladenine glycosylase
LLDRELLLGDAPEVAPLLLNKLLVAGECVGRISEVEAYTPDDPASHSHRGRTARNAMMFEAAGHLYCYLIYGMHVCANVVTGQPGDGSAVLIRAVTPLAGIEAMAQRRGRRTQLTDGPGKVCRAFGITMAHNGLDLCAVSPVTLRDDGHPPPPHLIVGPRVGITRAVEHQWRWRVPTPNS